MRSIGTLNLTFGLTTFSFKINSFLDYSDISFRQLCPNDKTPISYVKKCSVCQQEFRAGELLSGFEVSKDNVVVIDKSIFDGMDKTSKIIAIINNNSEYEFLTEKCYLLSPTKENSKAYFLLREVLLSSNKSLVIQYSMRKKLHLGIIKSLNLNGVFYLLLKQILYCDKIKSIEQLREEIIVDEERELGLKVFTMIAETLKKVDFLTMKDERKQILEQYLKGEIKTPQEIRVVSNLMEDLKKSVEILAKPKEEEEFKEKVKVKKKVKT